MVTVRSGVDGTVACVLGGTQLEPYKALEARVSGQNLIKPPFCSECKEKL